MRARGHRETRRVIKSANDTMRMRSPECPRQNDTKVQCNAMQCVPSAGGTQGLQLSPAASRPSLTVHTRTIMIMMVMMAVVVGVYWEHCDDDASQELSPGEEGVRWGSGGTLSGGGVKTHSGGF